MSTDVNDIKCNVPDDAENIDCDEKENNPEPAMVLFRMFLDRSNDLRCYTLTNVLDGRAHSEGSTDRTWRHSVRNGTPNGRGIDRVPNTGQSQRDHLIIAFVAFGQEHGDGVCCDEDDGRHEHEDNSVTDLVNDDTQNRCQKCRHEVRNDVEGASSDLVETIPVLHKFRGDLIVREDAHIGKAAAGCEHPEGHAQLHDI